jgi:hypothetical protein
VTNLQRENFSIYEKRYIPSREELCGIINFIVLWVWYIDFVVVYLVIYLYHTIVPYYFIFYRKKSSMISYPSSAIHWLIAIAF